MCFLRLFSAIELIFFGLVVNYVLQKINPIAKKIYQKSLIAEILNRF